MEKENGQTDSTEELETAVSNNGENTVENTEENGSYSVRRYKKGVWITILIIAVLITAGYLGGAFFYRNHFFFGAEIGSFSCSNMTADEAREKIKNDVENYKFTFYEKDGSEEYVTGKEIDLKCSPVENIDELMSQQNPFLWITGIKTYSLPLKAEVTFVKDTLYNRITQLSFSKASIDGAKNAVAGIYYENGQYRVTDSSAGNVVSINDVYQRAKAKIKGLYLGMSLEKEGCYIGLDGEDTLKILHNLANRLVSSKITYKRGEENIVVDGNTIKDWVVIGEKSVKLNDEKIREFVGTLAEKYNTIGKERVFKTSGGSEVTVSGGDYGWKINSDKEAAELSGLVWNGETTEREPVYIQRAQAHGAKCDVGDTYVEVSIGAQHLWYYKDGNKILETDLVSGDPTKRRATPTGIYRLKYKDRNVTLKGADYETPVSFWMPFNGGVGMHDATWRASFGGNIYKGYGSHGCVNLPYSVAKKIYENISSGDPIVVY